jgi:hypothetical protein
VDWPHRFSTEQRVNGLVVFGNAILSGFGSGIGRYLNLVAASPPSLPPVIATLPSSCMIFPPHSLR